MTWVKKGLIFQTSGQRPFMATHAQVPLVDVLTTEVWRIYFSCRDQKGHSHPTYIEVNAHNPAEVLTINSVPLLTIGKAGTFDDCGIMPTAIVKDGDRKLMYYLGWNVRNTIPYHNSIGLAISEDDGKTFEKFSEGPLLAPTYKEPYFVGLCAVLKEEKWRMWYSCCTGWQASTGMPDPLYRIHYAESNNGIDWQRHGTVAIDYLDEAEGGLAVSCVFKEDGLYHMWFSRRNRTDFRHNPLNSYKISHATSQNGLDWQRHEAGFSASEGGWDSIMQAYPFVVSQKSKSLIFYNGNGFGQTGIGYAVKEK